MQYGGLIGKLQKNIFSNPNGALKYAGVGAATGAGIGAMTSDDGALTGARRGAVFGALVGGGIHAIPRSVSKTLKTSGFKQWDNSKNKEIGDELATTFKPFYDEVNTAENKNIMKSFVPAAESAFRDSKNDKDFALNTLMNMADTLDGMDGSSVNAISKKLETMGESLDATMQGFDKGSASKEIRGFIDDNRKIIDGLQGKKKVGTLTSAVGKIGFDSAYHHIVEPTAQFFKRVGKGKKPTGMQTAAFGASAFGVYESYGIMNNVSDGNYGAALGGIGMLAAGKLIFSGASNMIALDKFATKKGFTRQGRKMALIAGAGTLKFSSGVKQFGPEEFGKIQQRFNKYNP